MRSDVFETQRRDLIPPLTAAGGQGRDVARVTGDFRILRLVPRGCDTGKRQLGPADNVPPVLPYTVFSALVSILPQVRWRPVNLRARGAV